ncbi:MAG: helix-turn-helix domain-containing protein, partial [Firmicutes bacterium]|nr:helix-turn-helix domain-containing protein [Bacillota bacterium]
GVRLGRPKGSRTSPEKHKLYGKRKIIEDMMARGMSQRAIARKYKVDRNTLARFLKEGQPE